MIPENFKKLILIITQKTKANTAIWNKGSGAHQFKLTLPNDAALTISDWSDGYRGSYGYVLNMYNPAGEIIEQFETDDSNKNDDYKLLLALHKAANNQYHKVDETIDALLGSIDDNAIIGKREESDDDLPF